MRKIDMAMMLILAFVLSVEPIRGQSPTLQSYERAREVLDKSVAAYGGLENLRGIENFHCAPMEWSFTATRAVAPILPNRPRAVTR
jgi:hypothetical protein